MYGKPLHLTATTTITVMARANGLLDSPAARFTYTVLAQVAAPAFTPAAPLIFQHSVSVTMTCATPGATIYYTTDGSVPTRGSNRYGNALALNATTTVNAIALKAGMADSRVVTGVYALLVRQVAITPIITPAGGTYTGTATVSLSCGTAGATIYYTTDGSTPSGKSTVYTSPFDLTKSSIVRAYAVKLNYADSAVISNVYTITPPTPVTTPVFLPSPGIYWRPVALVLSCATPGATIYYTLDDTAPTTASPVYTEPLAFTATTAVRAMAVKDGMTNSEVIRGVFTIYQLARVATPVIYPATRTFTSAQNVLITCATNGAVIRYTTDGSTPTAHSQAYTGALRLTATTTLKVMGFKSGMADSALAEATFVKQ